MTASTQGLTAQGIAGAGIPIQPGALGPGLMPPVSEQFLGLQQQYPFPAPYGFGIPYAHNIPYANNPYGQVGAVPPGSGGLMPQSPFGTQFMAGLSPFTTTPIAHQAVQALVSQIAPVAQQMILPVFIGAVQQLTLLVAQLAMTQLAGQQPAWPWAASAWSSPQPWSQPIAGSFGQVIRPAYAY